MEAHPAVPTRRVPSELGRRMLLELASAIRPKAESSLIMRLSCGNILKSPREPAPGRLPGGV